MYIDLKIKNMIKAEDMRKSQKTIRERSIAEAKELCEIVLEKLKDTKDDVVRNKGYIDIDVTNYSTASIEIATYYLIGYGYSTYSYGNPMYSTTSLTISWKDETPAKIVKYLD